MDMKQIKSLMKDFDESSLSSIKINKEGFSIELEKATVATAVAAAPVAVPAVQAAAPIAQAAAPVAEEIAGDKILSPMVGTYYASPSPDSPVFVCAAGLSTLSCSTSGSTLSKPFNNSAIVYFLFN